MSKQPSRPLKTQQITEYQSSRKRPEHPHKKDQREDDENRPPSPSLPQLPHSTSPSLPPRLPSPSPAPLSAEDGATDEEIAITLDTREALFPEGKKLLHPQKQKHLTSIEQHDMTECDTLHIYVCVFQCPCLETGNSSIFLLLKALHLNSVTPPLVKSPYPLSQTETAAHRDRSDTHTCSGRHSPMAQQIPGQTASMTTATRKIMLIT